MEKIKKKSKENKNKKMMMRPLKQNDRWTLIWLQKFESSVIWLNSKSRITRFLKCKFVGEKHILDFLHRSHLKFERQCSKSPSRSAPSRLRYLRFRSLRNFSPARHWYLGRQRSLTFSVPCYQKENHIRKIFLEFKRKN